MGLLVQTFHSTGTDWYTLQLTCRWDFWTHGVVPYATEISARFSMDWQVYCPYRLAPTCTPDSGALTPSEQQQNANSGSHTMIRKTCESVSSPSVNETTGASKSIRSSYTHRSSNPRSIFVAPSYNARCKIRFEEHTMGETQMYLSY